MGIQPAEDSIPVALELTTEAQRKAFLHPVRTSILDHLARGPATISQIAQKLGVHPANVTHHFRKLEDAGIILLTSVTDHGNYVEKFYGLTAKSFVIKPSDDQLKHANSEVLTILRNDINAAISSLKGDDSESMFGLLEQAVIDRHKFKKFAARLQSLVDEFRAASTSVGSQYTINMSLYPSGMNYGPLQDIRLEKKRRKTTTKKG